MTTSHSEQIDKIAKALVAVRKGMKPVPMSGYNKFNKYSYSNLEDYVGATEIMLEHGLAVVASVESCEPLAERQRKNGGIDYAYQVSIKMKLIHESGQWLEIFCIGHAQDYADKGVYQAITGARKYAYACMFGLFTSDDPELFHKEKTELTNPESSKPNIKRMLAATIEEWGGIEPHDLQSAVNSIAQSFGMDISKPATLDQCADMLTRITEIKDSKTFLEVVRGGE